MPDELMKRPSINDTYVCRRAAEIIFPEVWRWMGRERSGCKEEEVIRDLMKVAMPHRSGYETSKALEQGGWSVDDGLVEILADTWVQDAIDELTNQWVRCLNIRPQFAIGDRVSPTSGYRRGDECTIARIDEKLAKYGVQFDDTAPNAWYTINFEDVGPILVPTASPNIPDKDAA